MAKKQVKPVKAWAFAYIDEIDPMTTIPWRSKPLQKGWLRVLIVPDDGSYTITPATRKAAKRAK